MGLKLHGNEHPDIASSYYSIGLTQYAMKGYDLAVLFSQQTNIIWFKIYGEEYAIAYSGKQ